MRLGSAGTADAPCSRLIILRVVIVKGRSESAVKEVCVCGCAGGAASVAPRAGKCASEWKTMRLLRRHCAPPAHTRMRGATSAVHTATVDGAAGPS
jgi:hypothetical protein